MLGAQKTTLKTAIKLIGVSGSWRKDIFKRCFVDENLTLELLSMLAHKCCVKNLQKDYAG